MVTSHELRTKAKILDVIQRMPEDGTIDDAIYQLGLLKAVAEGLEEAEQGLGRDHDEVFDELLNNEPEHATKVDARGGTGSTRAKKPDRGGHAKSRKRVRSKAASGR
jgi:hypothetical protein